LRLACSRHWGDEKKLALVLAAGLTLGPRPAQIVKPGEEAAYAAWLEGEMRKTAGAYAAKDCSSADLQSIGGAPLLDDVVQQHPELFFWLEAVHLTGCGRATVQQLGVVRDGDAWRALSMAPGSSTAGPSLQRDFEPSAIALAAAVVQQRDFACKGDKFTKSFRMADTRPIGRHVANAPWSEVWTFYACNGYHTIRVDFKAKPYGTTDFTAANKN
jgi:hypothetical protein